MNSCRLCLKTLLASNNISIHQSAASGDLVANLIIDLADIECSMDDGLPDGICETCFDDLAKSYEFRKMIRKNDVTLRNLYEDGKLLEDLQEQEENEEDVLVKVESQPDTQETMVRYSLSIKPMKTVLHNNNETQSTSSYDPDSLILEKIKEAYSTEDEEDPGEVVEEVQYVGVQSEDEFADDNEAVPAWVHLKKRAIAAKANAERTHKDPKTVCCMCTTVMENEEQVIEHARQDHKIMPIDVSDDLIQDGNTKIVQCKVCLKQFNSYMAMHTHRLRYTQMVQCPTCGIQVAKKRLSVHIKTHIKEDCECDVCGVKLSNTRLLVAHKKIHEVTGHYQCEVCSKEFQNEITYQRHMTHHKYRSKPFRYSCVQCSKGFRSEGQLRHHMRIHTGEKPFQCQYCEQAFTHKTDHRRHEWSHTGSPYVCRGCNRDFQRPSHLRQHESNCRKVQTVETEHIAEILYMSDPEYDDIEQMEEMEHV